MKICLDIRYRTESGASSYIRHVVPKILERAGTRHQFYAVKHADQRFAFDKDMSGVFHSPSDPGLVDVAWSIWGLPKLLKKHEIDVYHAMKMPGAMGGARAIVFTMHSIFSDYKGTFPVPWKTRVFLALYGNGYVKRASRVVAVSEFVRTYLLEQYHVSPDIVDTIPHGVDPLFSPRNSAETKRFLLERSLPESYVLCVGNVTPVKNQITAVEALAQLQGRPDLALLIAGGTDHPAARALLARAGQLGLADRVKLLGFVQGEDLVLLMNGAQLLLMPSLTEGCPVTLLEAFGCGVPVVASSRGGLVDVGKETCRFVSDPHDATGFAQHIDQVLASPALRSELAERSRRRSQDFSWSRAAEEHLRTYERSARRDA